VNNRGQGAGWCLVNLAMVTAKPYEHLSNINVVTSSAREAESWERTKRGHEPPTAFG